MACINTREPYEAQIQSSHTLLSEFEQYLPTRQQTRVALDEISEVLLGKRCVKLTVCKALHSTAATLAPMFVQTHFSSLDIYVYST